MHERALRIISKDYISSFSDLVTLLKEKTIHQRCINLLMTEVLKYLNGLSPDLMNEVFKLKWHQHHLRNFSQFETNIPKTKSSINSCAYRANQLWQLVPCKMRKSMSLAQFKSKISKWVCQKCPCHLCQQYIKNIGYIN